MFYSTSYDSTSFGVNKYMRVSTFYTYRPMITQPRCGELDVVMSVDLCLSVCLSHHHMYVCPLGYLVKRTAKLDQNSVHNVRAMYTSVCGSRHVFA